MESSTIVCSSCNTINPNKNVYCQTCGKPLVPAQPPMPPAVPVNTNVPPPPPSGFQPAPQAFQPQGAPAPAPVYTPPPPPPPMPIVAPALPTIRSLGVKLDSWTEIYAGAADKEKAVEQAYIAEMQAHPVPATHLAPLELTNGQEKRLFHVIQSRSGTVATRIDAVGKDLNVSWALYAQQKPNWKGIGILIGVVFGVSLLSSFVWIANFGQFLLQFLFGSFNWVLATIVVGALAGKIARNDFWAYFMQGPDEFEEENLEVMAIVVQQAIDTALEKAEVECHCCCGEGCNCGKECDCCKE